MVVKRKLNSSSNGFDFPNIPKAPRSSRRKVSSKIGDDHDDDEMCAIDLLASLAGKLLEESESSSSTNACEGDDRSHLGGEVKKEHGDEYVMKPVKSEFSELGTPVSKSTSENTGEMGLQVSSLENDCALEPLVGCGDKKESGVTTEETGVLNGLGDGGLIADPSELQLQSPESVQLDGDVKLAPGTDRAMNDSFVGYENRSKLVSRDDDENYCKYYKLSDKCKSYRPLTRVGNRRMKKSMTKYGRVVPRSRCFEDSRADGYLKALYRKRKLYYGYNSWKHETVYKNRRLSDKKLVVSYDGGLSSESVSNSPVKGESENGGFSAAAIGHHSKDSRVKFSIKSFKIPELFIEVPETATVGSLKRTVREAVTALLGGGIRIGVLVQGKKVRDDNNTLSQTGLSCRENLSNLGFTLEPATEKLPVPLCSENRAVSMATDSTNLSERSAASPEVDSMIHRPPQEDADHLMNSGNSVVNNHELVPYQSDVSTDEQPSSGSRALVPVPALESEALAIVPINEKPKRTELSQRRTRRPFSVTEVEALVHAVEEIGTGRWRDVKLRSFENANHRTYVDLKDKWKTLVHTARISPQQRRGEPVPQDLLDRVLAAHTYWSQNQMKQNGKPQLAATVVV